MQKQAERGRFSKLLNNTQPRKYIQLGQVVKPHGLWGEVKIILFNPSSRTLQPHLSARLEYEGGKKRNVRIRSVRYTLKFATVQFEEFETINDVKPIIGYMLSVERSMFPAVSDSDYYIADLIGYLMIDESGKYIGIVKDILTFPANEMLVADVQEKEIMIPMVDEFIRLIDFEKHRVTVKLIDGFLEI